MMFEEFDNNKGITLVSLVVTIIVLLIIAAIPVNIAINNNGAINKTVEAAEEYTVAQIKKDREVALPKAVYANAGEVLKRLTNSSGEEVASIVADGNEDMFVLPDGFYYVGGTVESGVVISDESADNHKDLGNDDVTATLTGNQWVWVPVWDASIMYENKTATLYKTSVITKRYSRSEIIASIARTIPGNTSTYREPDVVTTGSDFDAAASNRTTADSRFTSLEVMAQILADDYNDMIRSIDAYGGFYVGRYELNGTVTSPTLKKGTSVLTNENWYNLYKANKKLGNGKTSCTTNMIWGCQWDVMCNWLSESGYDIKNSTSWGNYSNNTATGHGTKQNTGYRESWKANNLYDVAGNVWEWTMEADGTYDRAIRGSYYNSNGSGTPASSRDFTFPTFTYANYGSRPTLIINP